MIKEIKKQDIEQGLQEWYIKEYPGDELGPEINKDINFYNLFKALDNRRNIYDYIQVGDSIVRERLFSRLAIIMQVEYNYIYEQWLNSRN